MIVKFADTEKFKQQKKAQQQAVAAAAQTKIIDPTSAAVLYQINPLLANIATNPLAATVSIFFYLTSVVEAVFICGLHLVTAYYCCRSRYSNRSICSCST